MEVHDFYNHSRESLAGVLGESFSMKPFRADQLFQWVYRHKQTDPSSMTNIGKEARSQLESGFEFPQAEISQCEVSNDGTRKYLFHTNRGNLVESVMIKQPTRMTLCISSQVGCGMACRFCRTGEMGFLKNLTTSEILQQVNGVIKDSAERWGDSFSNIVFMGMGEPLHNYKNVREAISILTDQNGLAISPRKITVSTVGLVPRIEQFGTEVKASLAVSLNATTDEVRSQIMPVNKRFPLKMLLKTLRELPLTGRKKVTIEYVMLAGVNDTAADLARLPKILHGINAKINLIPYNENAGLGFKSPKRDWVYHWQAKLNRTMDTTVRWSKGQDINAACGQLATDAAKKVATA